MHNTTELRDGLADLAESVVPTEGYEGKIIRRADRRRGRRVDHDAIHPLTATRRRKDARRRLASAHP